MFFEELRVFLLFILRTSTQNKQRTSSNNYNNRRPVKKWHHVPPVIIMRVNAPWVPGRSLLFLSFFKVKKLRPRGGAFPTLQQQTVVWAVSDDTGRFLGKFPGATALPPGDKKNKCPMPTWGAIKKIEQVPPPPHRHKGTQQHNNDDDGLRQVHPRMKLDIYYYYLVSEYHRDVWVKIGHHHDPQVGTTGGWVLIMPQPSSTDRQSVQHQARIKVLMTPAPPRTTTIIIMHPARIKVPVTIYLLFFVMMMITVKLIR